MNLSGYVFEALRKDEEFILYRGWLREITAFRSFSSLHLIATMFVSERLKLVRWGFCANRSARNLCSKLCALPWRISKKKHNATNWEHIFQMSLRLLGALS
jgi:hypothetical protein